MPPIPTYSNSPVAAKGAGTTPQTEAQSSPEQPASAAAAATATTPAKTLARPGAAPFLPAVTPTSRISATYIPPTATAGNEPPPPEPGAFPLPSSARSHLPPPPKVGEKFIPPEATSGPESGSMPYPRQMGIPPPTATYPAQYHGMSITAVSTSEHGGEGLEHPPGYHQDTHASELDRFQRSAMERREYDFQSPPEEGEGIWDTAKKWAQSTGEKLAAAETEVWKRINKD
ncbi:hypothetical protein BX600DRAFT_508983 [Xylariales sp. PMI_506]|nr:hypothetical protein BX600DRAFT_508983 [Xylariales sp. PMI_506]